MTYDKTYSNVKNVFGAEPEKILREYYKKIDKSGTVLDIGAGQGRNTFFLAESGFSVDALDPSIVSVKTIVEAAEAKKFKINSFNKNIENFIPKHKAYSAILIFGLLQVLNPNSINTLIEFLNKFTTEGSLVFITAFSTDDRSFIKYKNEWAEVGYNSFSDNAGNYRTFFAPNDILKLFNNYSVLHHWEGLGEKHQHGNSPIEQHAMIELVLEKP
jgi:2-polyprenyl-3-methyl-5-hydroxy-6-metoxy-1,4-benzoquinol methylase